MLKYVIGPIHHLFATKDELWLIVRKRHLEYLFQPRLDRLKDIISKDAYHNIVMNLSVGNVQEAHKLVHSSLDDTFHSFEPMLRREWDNLIDSLDGIEATQRRFLKFGPGFY